MFQNAGLALLAIVLRLAPLFLPDLQRSFASIPHFKTPLTDLREVREMFFTYQHYGEWYLNPQQIG